jgi:hypothetical protein
MLELILVLVVSALGAYVGTYLREKAKGLATKEDVGEITKRVEEARRQYTHDLATVTEALKARTGMRMLAGERRLATHQEAYRRWHLLLRSAPLNAGASVADDCLQWWRENALFLDAGPRERFLDACGAAGNHCFLITLNRGSGPDGSQAVVDNMNVIRSAGPAIVGACELPALKEDEGSQSDRGFGTPGVIQLPPSGKE